MANRHPTPEQLSALAPLSELSQTRLAELAELAQIEHAERGDDPLQGREPLRPLFLLRGELLLAFEGGGTLVVVGGSGEGCRPLNRGRPPLVRSKAITDVDLLTLDDDLLDVLATWDEAVKNDARLLNGAFALNQADIQGVSGFNGGNPNLSAETKGAMQSELQRRGENCAKYSAVLAERHEAFMYRETYGGARVVLAELKSGDAFGEEALVSEAKRNATVTAITDAELLRVRRGDFNELLREPLLRRLSFHEAVRKVASGALWLDVRYPSEYQYDKLPDAINVPLAEVRNMFAVLDRSHEYVAYCQSGRRSAAAAFLFAQRGFRVWLLEGGLKQAAERRS